MDVVIHWLLNFFFVSRNSSTKGTVGYQFLSRSQAFLPSFSEVNKMTSLVLEKLEQADPEVYPHRRCARERWHRKFFWGSWSENSDFFWQNGKHTLGHPINVALVSIFLVFLFQEHLELKVDFDVDWATRKNLGWLSFLGRYTMHLNIPLNMNKGLWAIQNMIQKVWFSNTQLTMVTANNFCLVRTAWW